MTIKFSNSFKLKPTEELLGFPTDPDYLWFGSRDVSFRRQWGYYQIPLENIYRWANGTPHVFKLDDSLKEITKEEANKFYEAYKWFLENKDTYYNANSL